MGKTKENSLIDVVKFLFAILILFAHYATEWGKFPTILDYAFSLYIIVVPFFFACSGYFLYSKVKKGNKEEIYKNYVIRIMKLYLAWTVIYFCFKVVGWILQGGSVSEILHYLHTSLVFTTYPTIWFLPACAVAAVMMYFLSRKFSIKTIGVIALVLYIIGSLGYSYDFLLSGENAVFIKKVYEAYDAVFVTTRNGVFNGFPWFVLGCLVSEYGSKLKRHPILYGWGSFLCLILTVAEAVIIKVKFHSSGVDTVFFLIPFIFCLMMFLIKENIYLGCGKWMRKMSTLIFVSQRIFLTAIPTAFPAMTIILTGNSYVGVIVLLICVLLFSELIILASNKYKILKNLW